MRFVIAVLYVDDEEAHELVVDALKPLKAANSQMCAASWKLGDGPRHPGFRKLLSKFDLEYGTDYREPD